MVIHTQVSILPKFIYGFNTIPMKITLRFFDRYKQDYSKIYIEKQFGKEEYN